MKRRLRRCVFAALAVVMSLVVVLAVVEAGLQVTRDDSLLLMIDRIPFFAPPRSQADIEWSAEMAKVAQQQAEREALARCSHPVYHHGLKPMKSATLWYLGFYPMRTNSLGFKDASCRDVPLKHNGPRVLFMGDSFTEGVGVEYQSTFVGMIDKTMRPQGYDILNAGVILYSPAIYYAKARYLIEDVGLQFDEMIVCIDVSDAANEIYQYKLDGDRVVGLDDVPPLFAEHLAAWTFDRDVFDEYGRAGLVTMTANMDKLAYLLEQRGVRLTVVVYPWLYHVDRQLTDTVQSIHWREWSESRGADFVDLFPTFRDAGEPEQIIRDCYIPQDVHWTAAGHRIVADALLEHFQQRREAFR